MSFAQFEHVSENYGREKNAVSRIGISYQHAIVGKTLVAIISVLGMKEQCSLKKQKNATFGRRRYVLYETN